MIRSVVISVLLSVTAGDMPADVAETVTRIRTLLRQERLDAAEAEYEQLLKRFPDDRMVKELRPQFTLAHSRAGHHLRAAEHLEAAVVDQIAVFGEDDRVPERVLRMSEGLLEVYRQAERPEAAERPFDTILAALKGVADTDKSSRAAALARDLRALRAVGVAAAGRSQEAQRQLESLLHDAREELAANERPDRILHVVRLLRRQWEIAFISDREAEPTVRRELLTFLAEQSERYPKDALLLKAYFEGYRDVGRKLATRDPAAAEKVVQQAEEHLRSFLRADSLTRNRAQFALRKLADLKAIIRTEKTHLALQGQPAKPPVVREWLHGEPIVWENLRGRVVVLLFWSLGNRSSLQAFPKLREWKRAFADDGLTVIGLTEYVNASWDAEKRQPRRGNPQMPVTEKMHDDAVREFCQQTEVAIPVGVIGREGPTFADYGVAAVPIIAIIDREGRVQRVGLLTTSEARELEGQLKRLLDGRADAPTR